MKKKIAIGLVIILVLSFVMCSKENVVLDETKTYEITSDIHSLNIRINAADFIIKHADEFSVESNLKYLSVSEENGILTIIDKAKNTSNFTEPTLTLCVPNTTIFENVYIKTGAAKLSVDTFSTNTLELTLGAGDVYFKSLNVFSDVQIKGGAGEVAISNGTLNNLTLEMGLGELNLTASVLGMSDLKFGLGESNVTLIGEKNDYKINIERGLGNIIIDGKTVNDFSSSGNGQNHLNIKGGVGTINLNFQE